MAETKPLDFLVKSSLNVKSMGDPRKLAANLAHDGMRAVLGTIVGIAQGVNRRTDAKGGPDYYGLVGAFSGIPSEPDRPEIRSTICYLPDAIHAAIAATLKASHEKDPTSVVRFAVEAGVCKGGTAGFTWEFRPMFDGAAGAMVDPLADMRTAIKGGQKVITKQTEAEREALAAMPETHASRFDKAAEVSQHQTSKKGAART